MTKRPITARRASIQKLLSPDCSAVHPEALQTSLASDETQSVFTTAMTSATTDQVARAQQITGIVDNRFCVETYNRTGNPVWLFIGISLTGKKEELPFEIFAYLKQVGRRFFDEVIKQVQTLERVRTNPGNELQEYVAHLPRDRLSLPDIPGMLDLSQPGRSPFQAAAGDFQAVSLAAAIRELAQAGCTREEAYSAMAIALGRTSEDGPSTETIRKIALKGEKLLPKRGTRSRKSQNRFVGKTDG